MYSTWCRCWFHSRLNSFQVSLQVNVIQKLPPSFPLADWIFPPGTAPMRNSMANACKAPMAAAASVGSTPSVSRCGSPPYARQNCKTSAVLGEKREAPKLVTGLLRDVRFLLEKMVNWESETANDMFFNAKSIKTILEKVTTLVGCSEKKAMLNFLRSKEWDGQTHIMCPGYQDSFCFFTLSTLLVLAGPTKHCRNPTSSSF